MNRKTLTSFILIALIAGWFFLVVVSYYIAHKPFTGENALALLNTLGDVATLIALFALAAALGRRLTRGLSFDSALEAITLQIGFGFGLIALATLALGLLGLLHPILFWALLLIALIFLRRDLISLGRDLRDGRAPIESRWERALASFVLLALAIAFPFALLPPTAWDAQTYHLVIPKIAIERGRIAPPPDIVYFNFPSLGEMLFLTAGVLKGDIAAQIVHFGFFLLTLGAVFAFARRYFDARVAWLAVAILVAVPSLVQVATAAYVDLILAFYAFASLYALTNARDDARWLTRSAACAGFAMGVKYTAAIIPVALFILLLVQNLSRRTAHASRITDYVLRFTFYVSLVTLFASPWYLRNLVFTGNPVYPFVFGGTHWDSFRAEWFGRFGTGLLNTPLQLVTAPWDATILGAEGAQMYDATIGPLLLMLLPLLFFRSLRITHYVLRNLLIFSISLYLFWLIGIAGSKLLLQTRLLFPAFPALALLSAIVFERLRARDLAQFSIQRFARLVLLLVFILTGASLVFAFAARNPLEYLTGAETRSDYLARALGEYGRAIRAINSELPADARVLLLWEPRVYYVQRTAQPDSILDQFPHLLARTRAPDDIARAWRDAGYTHVLLNRQGLNLMLTTQYDPVSRADVRILQTTLAQHARVIFGEPLDLVNGEIAHADRAPYALYVLERR